MMGKKFSPVVKLVFTPENYERAKQSNSAGCLIADAIKDKGFASPSVDMATIRFTDRGLGKRFTYLTPPGGQHLLLAIDQGWPKPIDELVLRRAVKVENVIVEPGRSRTREEKLAEYEARLAAGEELTPHEKAALRKLRQPARPTKKGVSEVSEDGTIIGGKPIVQGPAHPNLLRSRNRHFGAKLANPGEIFQAALDAAVAEKLQEGRT